MCIIMSVLICALDCRPWTFDSYYYPVFLGSFIGPQLSIEMCKDDLMRYLVISHYLYPQGSIPTSHVHAVLYPLSSTCKLIRELFYSIATVTLSSQTLRQTSLQIFT
jgi:hypothetical protein